MARVGILGGTFDPPHNAHLRIAEAAITKIPLDHVLFMPATQPPHKNVDRLSDYDTRCQMVSIAIADNPAMKLSTMEADRQGPSYTADLLDYYKGEHGGEPFLIIGADSMQDLPNWKTPRAILELSTLVVFPRTGYASVVPVSGAASVVRFEEPVIDISSTDVRRRVRDGNPIHDLVPPAVAKFILDNSLYS